MSPLPRALLLLAVAMGIWQLASAGYMWGKAQLAQLLLEHSWQQTLAGRPTPPWPWADGVPVARLRVPRLGISQIVLGDASGRSLAFGPGLLSGSEAPGKGHSILSGHRDSHFRFVKDLRPGDLLILEDRDGGESRYRVREGQVLDARHQQLTLGGHDLLSLLTCYPFEDWRAGGPLRYLITAVRAPLAP